MVSLIIVSELRMLREALEAVLSHEVDFEVAAVVAAGTDVVELVRRVQPRVALVDLDGRGETGLSIARLLARESPATMVVALSARRTPAALRRALEAGIRGFASREQPPAELADLIRRVAKGERMIEPETALAALTTVDCPISARECEVLQLTLIGLSTTMIAHRLHLTPGTVRNYLSGAVRKLGCTNRLQAANRARDAGWL